MISCIKKVRYNFIGATPLKPYIFDMQDKRTKILFIITKTDKYKKSSKREIF